MTTLRFNDGVSIETSGPLRIVLLKDGYYIVGEGYLIDSRAEGEQTIAKIKGREQ